ncbi:MAG: YggS family pyridoxal phosphate-dependent enzyme [Chloroflexaceae bacterium]|nr:YggS family pyridoxal phosphate-dependent enzyme [Chloroflexaceae bacterium]
MIIQNIRAITEQIIAAAHHANRNPSDITLIAVTKTHPPDVIMQAVAAGLHHLGENRVQEADEKITALAAERARLRWHLIGHLQSNKAKRAAHLFDMIHSLDSVALAERLNRHRAALEAVPPLPVLLQVNISGEDTKEGFAMRPDPTSARLDAFVQAVAAIAALPALDVQGLMTIAPYSDEPEQARPVFAALRTLRDQLRQHCPNLALPHLSMGMTNDFTVAIEEGATFVRVGRAIFGERPPLH